MEMESTSSSRWFRTGRCLHSRSSPISPLVGSGAGGSTGRPGQQHTIRHCQDVRGGMESMESQSVGLEVIQSALSTFRTSKQWADKAITQLPDEKLHIALDANTNSIAVIAKHVAGNLLSRWTDFLTT